MIDLGLFLSIFVLTAVLARLSVFIIPYPFTLTGFLRKQTHWYIHHIYIGLIILFVVLPLAFLKGFTNTVVVSLAIGLSLSLDELFAWITNSKYPKKKEFIGTVILYAIFILYVLFLNYVL